jgi:hypothetical protein
VTPRRDAAPPRRRYGLICHAPAPAHRNHNVNGVVFAAGGTSVATNLIPMP